MLSISVILTLFSFSAITFASPVPTTPEARTAAPTEAATGLPRKDLWNAEADNPDPGVGLVAISARAAAWIPGFAMTVIPTNFPITLTTTATATSTFSFSGNPFAGRAYTIWTGSLTITESIIEEWTAQVTSVPFTVKGTFSASSVGSMTISNGIRPGFLNMLRSPSQTVRFCCIPYPTPVSVKTTWITDTSRRDYSRTVHFSLTRFSTSLTSTFTTTTSSTTPSDYGEGQVYATYIIIETVIQSWSARPTSFPYTMTQTAIAQTWVHDQYGGGEPQSPAPSRTYHPTFVVGSIPSWLAEEPRPAQTETTLHPRASNRLEKRSTYNRAGTATILPSNLPTTLVTSSSYTTSTSGIGWNPFWETGVLGVETVSATETDYEIYTARPTSFPHSVSCYHIRTTSRTVTVYHIEKQNPSPWYCELPTSTTIPGLKTQPCWSYTPPAPVILGTSGTFTDIQTETFPYERIWHCSVTSFPSTITNVYTSSRTSLLTTTHSWDFGGGPFRTRTRTAAPGPGPTAGTGAGSGPESNGPQIGIYNITYIEVATVVEEWKNKPTVLPYTLTQTAEVTQPEVFTYMDGGLTATAVRTETTYPTLVVGEIKQLPIGGIENRTWEYKGW